MNGSPLDEIPSLDKSFRYHGLAANIPTENKLTIERLIKYEFDGSEVVTIGPQDIEIEFPLPENLANYLNRQCVARPKGCRDARIYGLRDSNGRYFYIGSTIKSLHSRFQSHKSAAIHKNHQEQKITKAFSNPELISFSLTPSRKLIDLSVNMK